MKRSCKRVCANLADNEGSPVSLLTDITKKDEQGGTSKAHDDKAV
jgi:hypothetical protein